MEELRGIKRESSSPLAPALKAKSVDDLLDMFFDSKNGSEEARESLDELIRRACLWTELQDKINKAKEAGAQSYNKDGILDKGKFLAPDPSTKGH